MSNNQMTVTQNKSIQAFMETARAVCARMRDLPEPYGMRKKIRVRFLSGLDENGAPLVVVVTNAKTSVYEELPVRVFIRQGEGPEPEMLLRSSEGENLPARGTTLNERIGDIASGILLHAALCKQFGDSDFGAVVAQIHLSTTISKREQALLESANAQRKNTAEELRIKRGLPALIAAPNHTP